MWHMLWPDVKEEKVPISHVTNGIHMPTWIASEMERLYRKYLGEDWLERHDDPKLWERVMDIPDEELWAVHQDLKRKLKGAMLGWAQQRWAEAEVMPQQVLAMGALLHPELLTIGFVRRFAEYKRPALIFRDVERLKRLIKDRWRPIQIIFAGKSHPADFPSKCLLQQVYNLATNRDFQGRIAFVEDYDMHKARYLVQGVDVWLNVPRRFNEACGTSGMKASLNGVPHLSVQDGWWYEGYNGENGWAVGDGPGTCSPEEEDRADAEALYRLLEDKIVPLYYERDRGGVPHGWVSVIKEAIRTVIPVFCARRMMKDYTEELYVPSATSLARRRASH
jgi:starch phosphorylase